MENYCFAFARLELNLCILEPLVKNDTKNNQKWLVVVGDRLIFL